MYRAAVDVIRQRKILSVMPTGNAMCAFFVQLQPPLFSSDTASAGCNPDMLSDFLLCSINPCDNGKGLRFHPRDRQVHDIFGEIFQFPAIMADIENRDLGFCVTPGNQG